MNDDKARRWRDYPAARLTIWLGIVLLVIWPFPWLPWW